MALIFLIIDAKEPIEHNIVCAKNHDHKYKYENGFHIDGSIDGSLTTYIQNCGLSNILVERHAESGAEIPNTHLRGLKQIDLVLATTGIVFFMLSFGLLDFDVIF
jgi:hypothetical protein